MEDKALDSGSGGKGAAPRAVIGLLVLLVGLQLLQTAFTFERPGAVFDPNPPVNEDYASMYYLAHSGREYFADSRKLWGYDPHYMAGFPMVFIWNSNVAIQVFSALTAPIMSAAVSLKLFYILGVAFVPLFVFGACRNLGLGAWESLAGAALGFAYFRMGLGLLLSVSGMITGCVVSYVGVYTFTLLVRYLRSRGLKSYLALCLMAPLTILIHKTGFVILFVPALLALAAYRRRVSGRVLLLLAIAAMVTVAGNWFWLYPTLKMMHYKTFLTDMLIWQNLDPLRPLLEYVSPTQFVSLFAIPGRWGLMLLKELILFGAVLGMVAWWRSRRELFWAVLGNLGFLFLLINYGSWWRVTAEVDPTRYAPVWHLTLCLPAAAGWSRIVGALGARLGRIAPGSWGTVIAGVAAAGLLALVNLAPSFWQAVRRNGPQAMAVRTELHPANRLLADWLGAETVKLRGRIMYEDSDAFDYERAVLPHETACGDYGPLPPFRAERMGSGYHEFRDSFAASIALWTDREFIGGLVPSYFMKHHFVSFQDGSFLHRDMADWSSDELAAALELYNVRWAVAWSLRSNSVMACDERNFEYVRSADHYRIYRVNSHPDIDSQYFIKGRGRVVEAAYNRIVLEDVTPEQGEIVLKYRWMETLASRPEFPMDAYKDSVVGDPVGFIRLRVPAFQPRIVIYNSYRFPE